MSKKKKEDFKIKNGVKKTLNMQNFLQKSGIEKISYPYKSLEDANSDLSQFKIFHNSFYKSMHRDSI